MAEMNWRGTYVLSVSMSASADPATPEKEKSVNMNITASKH